MKRFCSTYIRRSPLAAAFLAVAIGCLSFTPPASAATSTAVSLAAPATPVSPGASFTATVNVAPATPIAGMQFDLDFNPSLVSITKVEEGNLFKQNGASSFFNPGTIDNQNGSLSGAFGAIITPGQTVSSEGSFAIISFTAKSIAGESPLDLSNVIAGDLAGNSVSVTVSDATVAIANRAPVLAPIGNKIAAEGSTLSFTISASDPDGDTLTFSASGLPAGATFNTTTRTFSWTPAFDQNGSYTVHFQVSDASASDFEDVTISVGNSLRKDVNDDGKVNVLDMIRIGQHWGQSGPAGWIREDINEDGTISVLDATLIGQGWTG